MHNNVFYLGVHRGFEKFAARIKVLDPIAHRVGRLAAQTRGIKARVLTGTQHLEGMPGAKRFAAYGMENPGVLERSRALHQRYARGLREAGAAEGMRRAA
jgi:hypothetical protein